MTPAHGSVLHRPAHAGGGGGGGGLGDWFCVTVVQADADPLRDPLPDDFAGARDDGDLDRLLDVARRLGADPERLVPWDRDAEPFWDVDGPARLLLSLARGGDGGPSAVVVVEPNGFEGSRPEVLRVLSDRASVHSLFRGVHADRFSYAADGRVLVTFEPTLVEERTGEAPDALGADLADLAAAARAQAYERVDVLAVDLLLRRTGLPLDDAWWQGEHLLAEAAAVPDDAAAAPAGLHPGVAAVGALAAADPTGPAADLLLTTLQEAVRGALHLTGVADDPVLGAVLAQAVAEARLLRGLALAGRPAADDVARRPRGVRVEADPMVRTESVAAHARIASAVDALWDAYSPPGLRGAAAHGRGRPGAPPQEHDLLWQRLQAGLAVTELLAWAVAPADPYVGPPSAAGVLLHVRFALADRWPAFEDALVAHLAANAP